jgi:lipoate-protein ligase B
MQIEDLGTMGYRDAWARQESAHADVLAGGTERILLVEHPPVITFGRRDDGRGTSQHLVASSDQLAQLGVEVVQSDRGGDITFHGPGQLVAYPIVRLNDHRLSVGGYVRALENAVIDTLATFGVVARREQGAVGIWVDDAKVCAIGVRVRRGVTLHGLALNVTTDVRYFNLIVPCGLTGRPVTSLAQILGDRTPALADVKRALGTAVTARLAVPAAAAAT